MQMVPMKSGDNQINKSGEISAHTKSICSCLYLTRCSSTSEILKLGLFLSLFLLFKMYGDVLMGLSADEYGSRKWGGKLCLTGVNN